MDTMNSLDGGKHGSGDIFKQGAEGDETRTPAWTSWRPGEESEKQLLCCNEAEWHDVLLFLHIFWYCEQYNNEQCKERPVGTSIGSSMLSNMETQMWMEKFCNQLP